MNLNLGKRRGLVTSNTDQIAEGIAIVIVSVLIAGRFSGSPMGWLGSLFVVAGYWSWLSRYRHRGRLRDRQPQRIPHADFHAHIP